MFSESSIAHFVIAHLQNGHYDEARILEEATARQNWDRHDPMRADLDMAEDATICYSTAIRIEDRYPRRAITNTRRERST